MYTEKCHSNESNELQKLCRLVFFNYTLPVSYFEKLGFTEIFNLVLEVLFCIQLNLVLGLI